MSDELADDVARATQSDAAAVHAALGAAGATQEAREYLRKQSQIADLQIDSLRKKDEFELSHLRFRRFSDYARFALEIAVGLVVLLIVLGLGTMVWNASRDHDLVVDAFSVPPDIAQTGLTGTALANRVLDRVGAMDRSVFSFAGDFSAYHSDASSDVRVEIPDTGISIGELNRYLRAWLGNETHVGGELVRTPNGLSLTVRYGDNPGTTFEGSAADLGKLIQKSAEMVFRTGQPLRYADYLSSHGRLAEGRAVAQVQAHIGTNAHRAQAYISLGTNDYWRGDSRAMLADGGTAVKLDPDNEIAWFMLEAYFNNLDHEEGSLKVTEKMGSLVKSGDIKKEDGVGRLSPGEIRAGVDMLHGDETGMLEACKDATANTIGYCSALNLVDADAAVHDIGAARSQLASISLKHSDGSTNVDRMFAAAILDADAGDYAQAAALSKQAEALSSDATQTLNRDVFLRPFEAEAMARTGDIAGARNLAATMPDECDQCLRARGRIEMVAHKWRGAAHFFAIVSARTPDIPFADTDWGQMLLAKGDLDGAIAKFASANQKGPHFADPLEMWGEALIAKNRSDLALAKFEEAAKYAPNWGRLHLKWGEALMWSGDKVDAQKQFAIADKLDMTAAERAERARMHA